MHNKQYRFPKKLKYLRSYNQDVFVASDVSNTLYWFEYPDLKYKKILVTRYPALYDSSHHIDCDETTNNIACVHGELKKIGLFHWDTPRETMIYSFHLSDVEVVKLSPHGEYLCSGDTQGYSYLWNSASGRVIAILPRHADYVSAIAFDPIGNFIAIGSYDKTIIIVNLLTMQGRNRIQGFASGIAEVFFLSSTTLICVEKKEKVTLWNFMTGEALQTYCFEGAFITCATLSSDKEYLFVGTQNKGLKAIDLVERETTSFESLEKITDSIVSLCYLSVSKTIVYATEDRKLGFFNLLDDVERLTMQLALALEQRHYLQAYRLFLSHPFLRQTPLYEAYNTEWEKVLSRVGTLLEEGEIEEARELFAPFQGIAEKQALINEMLGEYRKFPQFKRAYSEGNIPLVYSLASTFPVLKRSVFFKEIEKRWVKGLRTVSHIAATSTKNVKDAMLEVLAPFQGIKEKMDVFHLILKQMDVFLAFQQTFVQKDFKRFFTYSENYSVLKSFPEYAEAIHYGDTLWESIHTLISEERYESARRSLNELKIFPTHYEHVIETEKQISLFIQFQKRVLNKDYNEIFSLLDRSPELQKLQCYKALEEEITKAFKRCEKFVVKGDIPKITEIVRDFYGIAPFSEKIRSLYTSAYSTQFMQELTLGTPSSATLNSSISLYLSLFGLDDTIVILIEHMKRKTGFIINVSGVKSKKDIVDFGSLKLPDFII